MSAKYSLDEIDEMRALIKRTREAQGRVWDSPRSASIPSIKDDQVESELRTLMMNGTSVDELRDAKAKAEAASEARRPRALSEKEERDWLRRALAGKDGAWAVWYQDWGDRRDAWKTHRVTWIGDYDWGEDGDRYNKGRPSYGIDHRDDNEAARALADLLRDTCDGVPPLTDQLPDDAVSCGGKPSKAMIRAVRDALLAPARA